MHVQYKYTCRHKTVLLDHLRASRALAGPRDVAGLARGALGAGLRALPGHGADRARAARLSALVGGVVPDHALLAGVLVVVELALVALAAAGSTRKPC